MSAARFDERALAAWVSALARDSLPPPDAIASADPSILVANRLGVLAEPRLAQLPARVPLREALREDVRAAAEKGLAGLAALRDIAQALDAAGIDWMLWKGPALAMQLWGDPLRRRFSDLDVIVAPRDHDAALSALERAGWRIRDGMPRAVARVVHGASRAYPLDRVDAPLVELHWSFAGANYPPVARVEDVLARAERLGIGGRAVRTPAGGDALLLLAMHATKHGWSQAEEVVSFARLVARDPAALPAARAAARAAGLPRVVALAEVLVERLAQPADRDARDGTASADGPRGAPDPERERIDAMADACIARMLAGDGAWRNTSAWAREWISRPADRARLALGVALRPTPQEWKWVRLPAALAWSYPAVRVLRLALRAAGLVSR